MLLVCLNWLTVCVCAGVYSKERGDQSSPGGPQ